MSKKNGNIRSDNIRMTAHNCVIRVFFILQAHLRTKYVSEAEYNCNIYYEQATQTDIKLHFPAVSTMI